MIATNKLLIVHSLLLILHVHILQFNFLGKNVNVIIAVGHSGFEMDKKIAKQVDEIDLVVGGHSNTFLYNGVTPSIERSDGDYPFLAIKGGSQVVPVVQAYKYSKYLGRIDLSVKNRKLIPRKDWHENNPILLDKTYPQGISKRKSK